MQSPIVVSVIISMRDEGNNTIHTVHSIINDLETFLTREQWEIILVDNGSKNKDDWRFIVMRGLYAKRNVRILHDPIAGNVTARNKGVAIAKGEYIFFSDAHMSYRIGSFKAMIEAIDETGGIVHPAVQWMGGYDPSEPSYQYTIKMGEKLWGTWGKSAVSKEKPFYIPVCGHCCLGVRRQQFIDFGGYNDWFRCYGGGELYLDLKWWMLGSSVASVPTAVGYHLSAGRGYSFVQNDLIHNMMLLGLALGADAFAERVYIRYLGKDGVDKENLDRMYNDAIKEATHDRDTMLPRCVRSFMETMKELPWDKKNDEVHGSHASAIGIFDGTWIKDLQGDAKKYFEESSLQRELSEVIQRDFSHVVYKG